MAYQFIQVEEQEGVFVITMDDPDTRNAMGREMAVEISEELDRFSLDPRQRVLVLTGRDPSFCSGANVKSMRHTVGDVKKTEEPAPTPVSAWQRMEAQWMTNTEADWEFGPRYLTLKLYNLQKPSIACVNGYAMGLGMGIALSCDIRIASEKAGFSEAFIRNGLIPADGSCWQLPRIIGLGNTLLLQYTGDVINGNEAFRLGLVSKVVRHEELMDETMELALRLAKGPTYSMSLTKWLVHKSIFTDFKDSLNLAGPAQSIARQTEDHEEGVRAFIEKRKPMFKGR